MIKKKPFPQNVVVHTIADDGTVTTEKIVTEGLPVASGTKCKARTEHQNMTPDQLCGLVAKKKSNNS